ncbi:MAG TPA: hypothetical protein VG073_00825 [Gaiellaceae bacterium]|nr:hypothetical protein [Gaiellaceae bacterium]
MVGGASPLLKRRAAAGAALLAVLVAYYTWQGSLPRLGLWGDIAFVALVLIPAVFALVWFALPARRAPWVLPAAGLAVALAVVLQQVHAPIPANFLKLAATTTIAFWFLGFFESISWVALVALIIPWVDAYSVWRGPTHHIIKHEQHLFSLLSFAFPVPGEHGAANLGVPDLLFFALFLAAAARWRLRVGWTWLALTASLGGTMALAVWLGLAGLPALPGLSLGFLVPNADLVWRHVRAELRRHGSGTDTPRTSR